MDERHLGRRLRRGGAYQKRNEVAELRVMKQQRPSHFGAVEKSAAGKSIEKSNFARHRVHNSPPAQRIQQCSGTQPRHVVFNENQQFRRADLAGRSMKYACVIRVLFLCWTLPLWQCERKKIRPRSQLAGT